MTQNLSQLQRKLGYQFKDQKLLLRALTHRSVRAEHNERLEFLGDSILNFVVGNALYQKMPHAKEGDLSRYRATLVCEEMLASLALEFHVGDFLILGPGELRAGGFRRKSIMADALEAIIAAIYLDSDIFICQNLVEHWYVSRLQEVVTMKVKKDPKSTLQEYLQSRKCALPHYSISQITGADHEQIFHVECSVEGIAGMTLGEGENRRIAEQEAAAAFLEMILQQNKSG